MFYHFHVNVFARPANIREGEAVELRGAVLPILRAAAFDAFLPVTFEHALEAIRRLPRLDAEPDGFFVIAGDHEGVRWQVDGHVFDFGDRLHRVELHGECPEEMLDGMLACVGWPGASLVFELVNEGVAFDEHAFRTWASAEQAVD